MHFDERDAGDFKIYTGAMEAADLGYLASVVIKRVRGIPTPREVYRDEDMACGHVCAVDQLLARKRRVR